MVRPPDSVALAPVADEEGREVLVEDSGEAVEKATCFAGTRSHPSWCVCGVSFCVAFLFGTPSVYFALALVPISQSCGMFGLGSLSSDLEWLRAGGSCAMPESLREPVGWLLVAFTIAAEVCLLVVYAIFWLDAMRLPHGLFSALKKWWTAHLVSCLIDAVTITFFAAVALVSVGPVLASLFLVVTFLGLAVNIHFGSVIFGKCNWNVPFDTLAPQLGFYKFAVPFLLSTLDNATDLATALAVGVDSSLGATYMSFAVLSILHFMVSFSLPNEVFESIVKAEDALLEDAEEQGSGGGRGLEGGSVAERDEYEVVASVPLEEAKPIFMKWLAWNMAGRLGIEVPLTIMDVVLVSRGGKAFLNTGFTVVLIGAISKFLAILVHGSLLVRDSVRVAGILTDNKPCQRCCAIRNTQKNTTRVAPA